MINVVYPIINGLIPSHSWFEIRQIVQKKNTKVCRVNSGNSLQTNVTVFNDFYTGCLNLKAGCTLSN